MVYVPSGNLHTKVNMNDPSRASSRRSRRMKRPPAYNNDGMMMGVQMVGILVLIQMSVLIHPSLAFNPYYQYQYRTSPMTSYSDLPYRNQYHLPTISIRTAVSSFSKASSSTLLNFNKPAHSLHFSRERSHFRNVAPDLFLSMKNTKEDEDVQQDDPLASKLGRTLKNQALSRSIESSLGKERKSSRTPQQQRRSNEWNTSIFPKPKKKISSSSKNKKNKLKKLDSGTTAISNDNQPLDLDSETNVSVSSASTATIIPIPLSIEPEAEIEFAPQAYIQMLAVMIGIATGVSVAFFKLSIDAIRQFCYGGGIQEIFAQIGIEAGAGSDLLYLAIPVLGGVAVAILNGWGQGFSPGLRGAVNEIDEDSCKYSSSCDSNESDFMGRNMDTNGSIVVGKTKTKRGLALDFRPVRKAIAATFTLGTGNSLGPEGPGVEIGVAVSRCWMALWPPDLQRQYDNDRISDEINNSNGGFGDQKDDSEDENSYAKIVDRISRNRLLLACGAAAGVSSGFNAPLSGVFFALEVVQASLPSLSLPIDASNNVIITHNSNDNEDTDKISVRNIELQQQSLSGDSSSITAILISSVVATLMSRVFLGDELALQVLTVDIPTPLCELPLYLLLGASCGLVSVIFSQTAKWSKDVLDGNVGPAFIRNSFGALPVAAQPIIGGLTCGGVGYFYPQVLFFGYETLNGLLENDNLSTELLLTLLVAKTFTTAVSAGSGLVGGTLAPSLFLGGESATRPRACIPSGNCFVF